MKISLLINDSEENLMRSNRSKGIFIFSPFFIHSELEKIGFQSISFFGNRSSKERNEMSIGCVDEIDLQVKIVEFGDRNL
jgi:hypothetical protein